MCFRPTDADYSTVECPNCGTINPGNATQCWKCKMTIEEMMEQAAPAAAPQAPSAPAAPGAPKAPGAPAALKDSK